MPQLATTVFGGGSDDEDARWKASVFSSHARSWARRKRGSEAIASSGPGGAWRRRRCLGPGRGPLAVAVWVGARTWSPNGGGERLWVLHMANEWWNGVKVCDPYCFSYVEVLGLSH
ncbi:hypothetical protein V8G54_020390 [Vigna mungo]|uniref:Uncharacterized protein n=1 Tax=Vigna mungo TaxID=3915 RepID=A0AAQ3RTC3_VIGMU